MSDKRISQLVERLDIENNDVLPIVALGASTTNKVTIATIEDYMQANLDMGVTSVGLTKTGDALAITGSPITAAGTINIAFAGTSVQYVKGNGSLATLGLSDITTALGYTPADEDTNITINGITFDLSEDRTWSLITSDIPEGTNLYFTNSRARSAISLTTTGTSGAATYNSSTGVFNIPNYSTDLSGYVPYTGATSAIDLNAKTLVNISNLGINTTTVPTILMRAVGDNNSNSRIAVRGYSSNANSSSMRVTKFRGTVGAPQAPQNGDSLGKFELAGYGTTSSEGYPQASFEGLATESWGATARGSKVVFKITPNTTTTQAIALTINQDKSAVFENSITGTSIIKSGGTSSQFLKADGSVDASAYITLASLSAGTGISYNNTTGVISSTITQYTDALARAAISLTTTGTSGSSVYNSTTGALNIPSYTLAGLGGLAAGFDTYGTLYARTAMTTYRDHAISAANDAPIKSRIGTEDNWIYCDAANAQWGIYHRNIDSDLVVSGQPTLPANSIAYIGANQIASYVDMSNGNGYYRGSLSASNLSGTNTGDQTLAGLGGLPLTGGILTGTITINLPSGGYAAVLNRPAVTNYIGFLYQTAAASQWFVGMRENSTNNYIVYNEVLGLDAFTIKRTDNVATFSGAYGTQAGLMLSGTTYGCIGAQRGAASASAGMNYFSVGVQKWFAGIYENTDNFGFYSGFSNTFPFTITPNGLVTFTRNESSYGMVRLKGSSVEASIGYGFATDTDATTWVVGKGAGLGDTTFGWYYGGVKMILTTGGALLVNTGTGVTGGGALQVNGNVNINGVFQINGVTIGGGGGSGVTGSGGTSYITKWTGSSTLGNSVMYESNNNIGIGVTSVPEKLTVNGNILTYASSSAWAEGVSIIVATTSTWGGIRFRRERSNYDGNWGVGYVGFDATDDLVFIANNAGTQINNILRLVKTGSVLVGTGTDAGYKLYVNGTIGSTGGFFDTSDARLKTLLEDNYILSSIASVKAKLYIKEGRKELGYYAQDLQLILPSAVNEGKDGFLSLSYAQVHTAKIAVIEDEVTILKNKVSNLEAKLQKYEA
jgi:hypothetical protein